MQELIDITCVIYIDNILIYSNNSTKYSYYIRQILKHFCEYLLYINLKKYKFNITKIKFLSFIVSLENI